jgi:hypothetical protein
MRSWWTPFAVAALCAIASCSKPAGGGAGSAGGAPGASGPDVAVNLSDLPRPRAGLWKSVLDDGDGKPAQSTICRSGKAPAVPKMPAGCTQFTIKKTFLGAYVMDMKCVTAEYSMTAHAVATGDFQTHLSGDTVMTMSSKQSPARTMKMHTEETYLGPCAPGQQPDDAPDEK